MASGTKKILIAALIGVAAASLALFLWARALFSQENVRAAIEQQLSTALGQPVSVGSAGAGIYPRVTLLLRDVTIGDPVKATAERLHIGTDLWALFSRRIEHASVRLTGARLELPLAIMPVQPRSGGAGAADLPVEIVSIDEIVLSDVEVVSAGRTLRADVELVPHSDGVTIKSATLRAEDMQASLSGEITDLSGPVGRLSLKTGTLHVDALLAFAVQFAGGALASRGGATTTSAGLRQEAPMNLTVAIDADAATLGSLKLANLIGTAQVTGSGLILEPIAFGLFAGKYGGGLRMGATDSVHFSMTGDVSNIDMTEVMRYAGSPDTISGRLSGKLDVSGRGNAPAQAVNSTSGTARIDIVDGVVRDLGLVRAVVIAGSGRSDQQDAATGPRDEPFTRLGATLKIVSGVAHTSDLRLESKDLLLSAAGTIALNGTSLDLAGTVQLSDALAARAGRDLVRYTQVDGRPTLPVRISGSADNPRVSVEVGAVLRQAITNKAKEEIADAIKKRLGGLFKK